MLDVEIAPVGKSLDIPRPICQSISIVARFRKRGRAILFLGILDA